MHRVLEATTAWRGVLRRQRVKTSWEHTWWQTNSSSDGVSTADNYSTGFRASARINRCPHFSESENKFWIKNDTKSERFYTDWSCAFSDIFSIHYCCCCWCCCCCCYYYYYYALPLLPVMLWLLLLPLLLLLMLRPYYNRYYLCCCCCCHLINTSKRPVQIRPLHIAEFKAKHASPLNQKKLTDDRISPTFTCTRQQLYRNLQNN